MHNQITPPESYQKTIKSFEDSLYPQSLNKIWLGRVVKGIHEIGVKKGKCVETALIITGIFATALMGSALYFSAEGAVLMFKDSYEKIINQERVPAQIGHAGEWSSQIILYLFVYFIELRKIIREADFAHLKKTYLEFIKTLPAGVSIKTFYKTLNQNFELIGMQAFLTKNSLKTRLLTIQLMQDFEVNNSEPSNLEKDRALEQFFRAMHRDLKKNLESSQYFKKLKKGISSISKVHGRLAQIGALATGILLPGVLFFDSFLSVAGTALVADDIVNYGEDLAAIGHAGEWPVNALTLAVMAFYLHHWSLTSIGELFIAREVIKKHLKELNPFENFEGGNLILYNYARKLCNHFLDELVSKCMFTILPNQYHV